LGCINFCEARKHINISKLTIVFASVSRSNQTGHVTASAAVILAVLEGKPIDAANATGGLIGSKSTPTTVSTPEANSLLLDIHGALLTIARAIDNGTQTSQIGSRSVVDAISTRAVRENAASYSGPRTTQPPRVSYPA